MAVVGLGAFGGPLLVSQEAAAQICFEYVEKEIANFPRPWVCSGALDDGDDPAILANQMVIDEHRNWHCIFHC